MNRKYYYWGGGVVGVVLAILLAVLLWPSGQKQDVAKGGAVNPPPAATQPTPTAEQREIADLKRKLAELQKPAAPTPTPAPQQAAPAPTAQAETPACTVAGSVYVAAVGGCVLHVTDVKEISKVSPDVANDPNCKGKPAGHKYDKRVIGPDGAPGIAHQVCGKRPTA